MQEYEMIWAEVTLMIVGGFFAAAGFAAAVALLIYKFMESDE